MADLVNVSDFERSEGSADSRRGLHSETAITRLKHAALHRTANPSTTRRLNFLAKRLLDLGLSGIALVVLAPFLFMVMLLIRLDSPGPAIFAQERWGKGMRRIRVFKFRTMFFDQGDLTGVAQTERQDARVTPIGRILRKTSIDELPQLWNVLRGDLSLVGPRCHPVGMKAAGLPYEELVPEYHTRHTVRPGITGLAQVSGCRGPTKDAGLAARRIVYDLEYISRFNILLDIRILFLTLTREVFGGSGF